MRAVNLIPRDARRSRGAGGGKPTLSPTSLGPSHFLVALLVIVVALIVLRVLADNTVNNRKATLAAVQEQVTAEQAQAAKLTPFITFVTQAQAREQAIETIAKDRFPWKTKFVELAHVLPTSTSLSSLSGTLTGAATSGVSTTATAAGTPSFTLAGCADTPNQNGTATLLRRLNQVPGVTGVNFQSSTRVANCGNSFNLSLSFEAIAGLAPATTTPAGTSTTSTATTTATTTTATTSTTTTSGTTP